MATKKVQAEIAFNANKQSLASMKSDLKRQMQELNMASEFDVKLDTKDLQKTIANLEKLVKRINNQLLLLAKHSDAASIKGIRGLQNIRNEAINYRRSGEAAIQGHQSPSVSSTMRPLMAQQADYRRLGIPTHGVDADIARAEAAALRRLNLAKAKVARIDKGQIFANDPLKQQAARATYAREEKAWKDHLARKAAIDKQYHDKIANQQQAAADKATAAANKAAATAARAQEKAIKEQEKLQVKAEKQARLARSSTQRNAEHAEIAGLVNKYAGKNARRIFNAGELERDRSRLSALRGLSRDELLQRGIDPVTFKQSYKGTLGAINQQYSAVTSDPRLQTSRFRQWLYERNIGGRPPGGGPPGSMGGGMFGGNNRPGRIMHHLNAATTNVASLGGTSLYGMGTLGAGTMLLKGFVNAAAEAQSLKIVLAGVVNTYARFKDSGGKLLSTQDNLIKSMAYAETVYSKVRQQAVKSPLTTKEMFGYFMAGAPVAMSRGLNDTQTLKIVDFMGTLGTAMNLAPRDIEQDIRSTLMGDVRTTNKIGKMLGMTGPEITKQFQGGPDDFMRYFESKSKNLQAALDKFAESFIAKWSNMIDAMQQAGIKIGTVLLPHLIKFAERISALVDEWSSSGKLDAFANSIGSVLTVLLDVFVKFVTAVGPYIHSVQDVLMIGLLGVIGRFVIQIGIQAAAMSGATGGFIGILAAFVAGVLFYGAKLKEDAKRAEDAYNNVYGTTPSKTDVINARGQVRADYAEQIRKGNLGPYESKNRSDFLSNMEIYKDVQVAEGIARDLGVHPDDIRARGSGGLLSAIGYAKGTTYKQIAQIDALRDAYGNRLQQKNTLKSKFIADPELAYRLNQGKLEHYASIGLEHEKQQIEKSLRKKGLSGAKLAKALADSVARGGTPDFGFGGGFPGGGGGGGGGAYTPTTSPFDVLRARINSQLSGLNIQSDLLPNTFRSGIYKSIFDTKNELALAERGDALSRTSKLKGDDKLRAVEIAQIVYSQALMENAAEYRKNLATITELNVVQSNELRDIKLKISEEQISGRMDIAKDTMSKISAVFNQDTYSKLAYETLGYQKTKLGFDLTNDVNIINDKRAKMFREAMIASGGNPIQAMMILANNKEYTNLGAAEELARAEYQNKLGELNREFENPLVPRMKYLAERAYSDRDYAFSNKLAQMGLSDSDLKVLAIKQRGESLIRGADQLMEDSKEKLGGLLGGSYGPGGMMIGNMMLSAAQSTAQKQILEGNLLIRQAQLTAESFGLLEESAKMTANGLLQLAKERLSNRIEGFFNPSVTPRVQQYRNLIESSISSAESSVDQQILQERADNLTQAGLGNFAPHPESYWENRRATLLSERYQSIGQSLNQRRLNSAISGDLTSGGIAELMLSLTQGKPFGTSALSAFSGFGEYANKNLQNSMMGGIQTLMTVRGGQNMLLPLGGLMPIGKMLRGKAWENIRNAGYQMVAQYAGGLLGQAVGGSAEASSMGASIGSGIALLAGANPWIAAGAALFGGLLGGLFGKKNKTDPAEEAHKKKLVDLLSSIDKSLRPQEDYFRTVRGEALFGSASKFYSGRNYNRLGLQVSIGQ